MGARVARDQCRPDPEGAPSRHDRRRRKERFDLLRVAAGIKELPPDFGPEHCAATLRSMSSFRVLPETQGLWARVLHRASEQAEEFEPSTIAKVLWSCTVATWRPPGAFLAGVDARRFAAEASVSQVATVLRAVLPPVNGRVPLVLLVALAASPHFPAAVDSLHPDVATAAAAALSRVPEFPPLSADVPAALRAAAVALRSAASREGLSSWAAAAVAYAAAVLVRAVPPPVSEEVHSVCEGAVVAAAAASTQSPQGCAVMLWSAAWVRVGPEAMPPSPLGAAEKPVSPLDDPVPPDFADAAQTDAELAPHFAPPPLSPSQQQQQQQEWADRQELPRWADLRREVVSAACDADAAYASRVLWALVELRSRAWGTYAALGRRVAEGGFNRGGAGWAPAAEGMPTVGSAEAAAERAAGEQSDFAMPGGLPPPAEVAHIHARTLNGHLVAHAVVALALAALRSPGQEPLQALRALLRGGALHALRRFVQRETTLPRDTLIVGGRGLWAVAVAQLDASLLSHLWKDLGTAFVAAWKAQIDELPPPDVAEQLMHAAFWAVCRLKVREPRSMKAVYPAFLAVMPRVGWGPAVRHAAEVYREGADAVPEPPPVRCECPPPQLPVMH